MELGHFSDGYLRLFSEGVCQRLCEPFYAISEFFGEHADSAQDCSSLFYLYLLWFGFLVCMGLHLFRCVAKQFCVTLPVLVPALVFSLFVCCLLDLFWPVLQERYYEKYDYVYVVFSGGVTKQGVQNPLDCLSPVEAMPESVVDVRGLEGRCELSYDAVYPEYLEGQPFNCPGICMRLRTYSYRSGNRTEYSELFERIEAYCAKNEILQSWDVACYGPMEDWFGLWSADKEQPRCFAESSGFSHSAYERLITGKVQQLADGFHAVGQFLEYLNPAPVVVVSGTLLLFLLRFLFFTFYTKLFSSEKKTV